MRRHRNRYRGRELAAGPVMVCATVSTTRGPVRAVMTRRTLRQITLGGTLRDMSTAGRSALEDIRAAAEMYVRVNQL